MSDNLSLQKILSCLLLCMGASGPILLSAQDPRIESITIADGLSQGMIYDIEQSNDGFMWFATKDGLNRYDGYHFEVFTNDPFNKFSIAGNDIHHLFEDSRGNLWLSIDGKGLDMLEKQTGKFLHFPLDVPPFVTETSDGAIWVASDKYLFRLRWPNTQLNLPDSANLNSFLTIERVPVKLNAQYLAMQVEAEADGSLLISTYKDGLFRYSPANGQLTLLHPDGNLSIQCRTDKGVWVVSPEAEVWLVEKGGLPRQLKLDLLPQPYKKARIMSDGHGNLIVSYTSLFNGSGFFRISEDELVQQGNLNQFEKIFWLDLFSPWSEVDRSGNLWVGTSGYGLRKTSLTSLPFQHLFPGVSVNLINLANNQVYIPVTLGKELYMPETATLLKTRALFPAVSSILWLMQSNNGTTTYLLCYVGEQSMLGIVKNGETRFLKMPYPPSALGFMFIDSKDRAWISAIQGQLVCYLPANDQFVMFDLAAHLGNLPLTYAVNEDAHHDIWVGTDNGAVKLEIGKLEIDKLQTNANGAIIPNFKISKFQTIPSDPRSLRNNFVAAFCPDPLEPERYLWLGTKGGGLNLLDLTTNEFEHLTSRNSGLPNDVVYGILPDDQGNIWGSTNRGLFRLNISVNKSPVTNHQSRSYRFRNFRAFDGLQGDEFNTLSYFKGKDGRLYFGGVEGLTVFNPTDIVDRKSDACVQLTDLKINNVVIDYSASFNKGKRGDFPLDRPLQSTELLCMKHDQSTVTLDFALMDFVNPKENRYRYRLQGADGDWVEAGVNHAATYTNLSPGNYIFEVQGSISGGEWSNSATLKIKVLPPWWETWWAYGLYFLAISGALFLFYKMRLRQRMEHQEAIRLQELDAFKSRFFTNITHEFRTPLTVILGNLEIEQLEIEQLGKPADAKLAQFLRSLISKNALTRRSTERLLRLINQILDLAKLESNSLKINYVQGDVLPYLRYICESLHSFANAQNVLLRVESSEAEIKMDYDPERLLQIVHNLLSNAVKFTPSGGKVTLRAGRREGVNQLALSSFLPPASSLVLSVNDTGVGIPPEDLPHIFDRFYQANNLEKAKAGGTGIGLSLTKELVKAMGGDISVESEMGKGTAFTVRLPIKNEAAAIDRAAWSRPLAQETPSVAPLEKTSLASHDGERPTILIIEDNPDVVEYLAACLSSTLGGGREGAYQLDFAYNGRAGIEKALETVPDLIVSDVMMPEKDGFEVCDTLKNDERTSHIPLVLLTAKADVESRIAGLKRGADAYLAKPFHREELRVTLAGLLELRRKLQLHYQQSAVSPRPSAQEITLPTSLLRSAMEDVFLQRLRNIIEENLSNASLDVDAICKKIGMGRTNLHNKLSALTGLPITLYVRKIRLQRAKELLGSTQMNVSEVAYEVGFNDPKFFSRVFSEEFGITPSDFKKH